MQIFNPSLRVDNSLNSLAMFSTRAKAIRKISDITNTVPTIKSINKEQKRFSRFNDASSNIVTNLESKSKQELERLGLQYASVVSHDANEVNKTLQLMGFTISLPPVKSPNSFCAGAGIKYHVQWITDGFTSEFSDPAKSEYSVFELYNNSNNQLFKWGNRYVAKLQTKEGLIFWIVKSDATGMGIWEEFDSLKVAEINGQLILVKKCKSMKFPKMSHHSIIDVSWLKGTQFVAGNRIFDLENVKQEIFFNMDEFGSTGGAAEAEYYEERSTAMPLRVEFDTNFIVACELPNSEGRFYEVKVEYPN